MTVATDETEPGPLLVLARLYVLEVSSVFRADDCVTLSDDLVRRKALTNLRK